MPEHMYERIADVLREQILGGDLSPGDRLPTQAALSEQYGVSRVVARQALELLDSEGLVDRGKGSGTFVRARQPVLRRSPLHYRTDPGAPYAEEAISADRIPRYSHETRRDRAGADIARRLNIAVGDDVVVTDYISYADDEPTMLTTSYEPFALTGGTPIERPEEPPMPAAGLVDRFESIGHRPVRVVERVRSRMPRPSEIEGLALRPGVPVLIILRITIAESGPVETADLILATDQFELEYPIPIEPPSGK